MSMIKIVHIGRPVSGVGVYIDLLSKHIDEKKFLNILICNTDENIILPKNKIGDYIKTCHVNLVRELKPLNDFKTLLKIIKIIKIENPDIIHCHSAKAGVIGRLVGFYLKKKTFYTPHAYSYLSSESKLKKNFFIVLERLLSYTNAMTLACSKSEFNRALKDLYINEKKVLIWENSIEDNFKFSNSKILKELPEKFLCSIGRPSFQKNTELLVKAISMSKKEYENIHLVILGAGLYSPSLNKIKQFINDNKLSDNITIIPWLERAQTLEILKNSLFYVSTSRYEGLPYSLIEALALSKPCIVTNVDGNIDLVINNENGFVVNEDQNSISEKISFLYDNNQRISEMASKSRELYLKRFNINNNILKLETIYLS
jgi:glycosyltransferase involved in cell wall biosynthesis